METLIALVAAVIIGLIGWKGSDLFVQKAEQDKRKKKLLNQIQDESGVDADIDLDVGALRSDMLHPNETIDALLRKLPAIEKIHFLLLRSGLTWGMSGYLAFVLGVFLLFAYFFGTFMGMGFIGWVLAVGVSWLMGIKFLGYKVRKRSEKFIDMFPDAVDMIVRSVRSGHPVNTALKMISENMDSPIREEFKQVVNEIAYGRTMVEALESLTTRIEENDLRFFVVVLNVQQETGGNLGEVLSNLSNILRRRKQLRLKIKALTSEGRMSAYIIGSLPLAVLGILHLVSPTYLEPLFDQLIGNFVLGLAACMVGGAFWITMKMVDIEI